MQEQEYFYNISGFIRQVYPNGYGFIIPKEKIQENDSKNLSEVYFHFSSFNDKDMKWKDVSVGQKVTITSVVKSMKGYSAMGVEFIRPEVSKVKKNRTGAYK